MGSSRQNKYYTRCDDVKKIVTVCKGDLELMTLGYKNFLDMLRAMKEIEVFVATDLVPLDEFYNDKELGELDF